MKVPQNIIDTIQNNDSFLAHAHLGPDADSVASILAFKLALEQLGKVVNLYAEDTIRPFIRFLPGIDSVSQQSLEDSLKTFKFDIYVSLDSAATHMISHHKPFPEIKAPILNIDHHPDNDLDATYNLIDDASTSTTQILFYLFKELKIDITSDIATCLLFGIIGDTNAFTNYNTTAESLNIAATLMSLGADYHQCVTALTRSTPFEVFESWGELISRTRLSDDGTFIWTSVSYDEPSASKNFSTGLFANEFSRRIEGTKFGAALTEKEKGITKGAIRSRDHSTDVAQIARLLGGGGHTTAAGFMIEKPLKEAEQEFLNAVKYLQKQGKL